jgi:ribosome-binding factor A
VSDPRRAARVGKRIQEELSDMILRGLKDPRLEMVSITAVEVTEDLQFARIFFTIFDPGRRKGAEDGFKSAMGYIRRELRGRLDLRKVPDLAFEFDGSFDYGQRMERLLKEAREGSGNADEKNRNS